MANSIKLNDDLPDVLTVEEADELDKEASQPAPEIDTMPDVMTVEEADKLEPVAPAAAPVALDAQALEKQHQAKIKSVEDQQAQADAAAQAAKAEVEDPANWSAEQVKKYYKDNPPKNIEEAAKARAAIKVKEDLEKKAADQIAGPTTETPKARENEFIKQKQEIFKPVIDGTLENISKSILGPVPTFALFHPKETLKTAEVGAKVIRWPFWRAIEHPVSTIVTDLQQGKMDLSTIKKGLQSWIPFHKIPEKDQKFYGDIGNNYYKAITGEDSPPWYQMLWGYGLAVGIEPPIIKGMEQAGELALTRKASPAEMDLFRRVFNPLKQHLEKSGVKTADLYKDGNVIKLSDKSDLMINDKVSGVLRGDTIRVPRWWKIKPGTKLSTVETPSTAIQKAGVTGPEVKAIAAPAPAPVAPQAVAPVTQPAAAPAPVPKEGGGIQEAPAPEISEAEVLARIKEDVKQGEAGYRTVYRDEFAPVGEDVTVTAIPSTFPEYFQNKGYTKQGVLTILAKKEKGVPLSTKEQATLADLTAGARRVIEDQEYHFIKKEQARQAEVQKARAEGADFEFGAAEELHPEVTKILQDTLSDEEYDEFMAARAEAKALAPVTVDQVGEKKVKEIVDEHYGKGALKKKKVADLVIGLPAAGKTKYFAEPIAKQNGSIFIDNDLYKPEFDEFKGGIGSEATHDIASNVIEPAIMRKAIGNNDNIVIARLGKNVDKMKLLIKELKAAGYKVNLHFVDLPYHKAIVRAVDRFKVSIPRRFVDPYFIQAIGLKPAENYDILKMEKGVDSYGKWSTDVERGQQAKLIEKSPGYRFRSPRPSDKLTVGSGKIGGAGRAPEAKPTEESALRKAEKGIGAEVDQVLEDVTKASQAGAVGKGVPSPKKARVDDTVVGVDKVEFGDKATETRWKTARGIGTEYLPAKIWQGIKDIFHQFKEFPHLSKDPKYAQIKNDLRILSEATGIAKDKTLRILNHLTFKLGKNKLDLFTRKTILDDLMYEASRDHDLPFGFTAESIKAEHEKISRLVELNPDIKQAIENRKTILEAVKKELVKAGVMKEEAFKNPTYFRHQVLEYFKERQFIGKAKLKKVAGPYTKMRKGSELDINTDYLQAEFEWLASALKDIEVFKVIDRIEKSPLNIKKTLETQAKDHNKFAIEQHAYARTDIADTLKDFKVRIAIALSKLRKLKYLPDFTDPEYGEVNEMAEIARIAQGAEGEEEEAVISARSMLKAISERKKYIKKELGPEYKTWKDLIPKEYGLWQPKKGNLFMSGKTVTEAILDRIMDKVGSEVGITEEDLRDVIIFGPKLKELVIPQELIDTIEDTFTTMPTSVLDKAIDMTFGRALTWWKKWILFSPMRAFKYNYQNFIGDFSGMVAGNPQAVTKMPQAVSELRAYFRGGTITDNLRDAIDRAVIQTSLTLQEIPDIAEMDIFTRFNERSLRDKINLSKMWWTASTKFTRFREAILRYAVYLDYLEKVQTGEYGAGPFKAFKYGASKPEEINTLVDPKDKAAKLSRELMVDYGAISPAGKWLRRYAIPFYSWLEGNMKRYNRLFANATREGAGKGRVGKAAGFQAGAQGTMYAGMWALRFILFYAAAQAWNMLFHGEEEKQVSEYDRRRLHIVLGTDEETGDIIVLRGQDAFGDYAEWFGLNELPMLLEKYNSGQISISDFAVAMARSPMAKALNGIGPHIKMPLGMVTGRELDPSTMKVMTIRDKGRYLARTLAMEDLYNIVAGKPTRGMGKALEKGFISRQDPGENAYNYILNKKGEWGEKMGRGGSGDYFTPRSTHYADYKKALKYGDRKAAINALTELQKLGVKKKDLKRSLETADPLYGIPKKEKKTFVNQFLTADERQKLIAAMRYYNKVFKGK